MIDEIREWRHVFKLDPDKPIDDEALERICISGTNAVMIGGSSGVTFDNTVELLSRVRRYEIYCALEVSGEGSIVPGFDGYLIPTVLNAADGRWITGLHQRAIRDNGAIIDWDRVLLEGYVIGNPQCTAAIVTEAAPLLDEKDLVAYARMADKLFRLPIFYLEYSGRFGPMDWVRSAARVLGDSRLFYGGGIDGAEKAREAAEAGAHTVVVGNVIYENLPQALATVQAVIR